MYDENYFHSVMLNISKIFLVGKIQDLNQNKIKPWASQVVLVVKNLPASLGDIRDVGSIPGSEDSLEEGMATYSSILAWTIP